MENREDYLVRCLDIDILNVSLRLCQKLEGDVGCVVWDASIVLAKYLEELFIKNHQKFKSLNIVELGSGVGCVGLTAACFGANVVLTDLEEMLPLLEKNIEYNKETIRHNHGNVRAACLIWGDVTTPSNPPDLILMADCIYYKQSIDKLLDTLKSLSGSNTKILLSQEMRESQQQRECWSYFFENITKHFNAHFVPLEDQNDVFRSKDIIVLEFTPILK